MLSGSHTCTAERQFRYPNEYGSQKPPYFQQTATAAYYDLILSGDLGHSGSAIARQLLELAGVEVAATTFADCGLLLYHGNKSILGGGSGCGCAAAVGFGHVLRRLREGSLRRVLLCATGALLSPLANQQKESIPAICHAVALERSGDDV